MTSVEVREISKHFGETLALDRITLEIAAGELFFLLGPSGCGKSTLLRLIAGLHEPTEGQILFNGRDVTGLGTEKRNAVMCFQSYALWPHMSVRENIRFGLSVRGISRGEQQKRIDEVLRLVRMSEYADRKPNQLSGGQQQRVALARAIAVRPAVLLLDEPLSNLDAKLRHEMRSEIRRICKESGLTTIYVTHDQKEALSVADRIAVLKDGRLMQIGTPGELYHRPASTFVAAFIGQTNLVRGSVIEAANGMAVVETTLGRLVASLRPDQPPPAGRVVLSIRPEQMQIASNGMAESDEAKKRRGDEGTGVEGTSAIRRNRIVGRTLETTFLGEASEHTLEAGGQKITVIAAPPLFDVPAAMTVEFDAADVVVLAR